MRICAFDGKCVIKRNLRVWYLCRITKSINFRAGVVMSSGSRLQPSRNFLQHLGGEGRRIRPSSFGNIDAILGYMRPCLQKKPLIHFSVDLFCNTV